MRLLLLICVGFIFSHLQAQPRQNAEAFHTYPKDLALYITAPYKNEREKVYALFRWITDNIDYRLKPVPNRFIYPDTSNILKPLDEIVAEDVLQKGVAVCDGYSRLFKTLCNFAGIPCETIRGYVKNASGGSNKFVTNHTWNAVFFDSAWHLADVAWASGYISYRGGYFVREYDPYYFLTAPQKFIQDHYPEDPKWTLLPIVPTFIEFEKAPFKTQAYLRTKVKSYYPANGLIKATVGDTIALRIELPDKSRQLYISDSSLLDGTFLKLQPAIALGNQNHFYYTATHPKDAWLEVVCDDEVVLRYKLLIKEKNQ